MKRFLDKNVGLIFFSFILKKKKIGKIWIVFKIGYQVASEKFWVIATGLYGSLWSTSYNEALLYKIPQKVSSNNWDNLNARTLIGVEY